MRACAGTAISCLWGLRSDLGLEDNMKKRIIGVITFIVFTMLFVTGCKSKKDTIIVGTEAGFAPYEYLEGDEVVGVDMDIAKAIADYLGKELVIKNMDFKGALAAVQSGQVDFVAAGVSVDEERMKVMDFSVDYVDSTEVVVVNKENPMVSSIDDLDGKIIGVQEGNIADFWVE